MSEVAVSLNGVSVGYNEGTGCKTVLRGITASLESGELVALIGCNGAGKSTLLRTLSAEQKPLAGDVEYRSGKLSGLSAAELAKEISIVLTGSVVANMKVRELVSLGRLPYTGFLGRLSKHDRQVVEEALQLMGISEFAGRDIDSLSDGERQKCMIAKALAQDTPLMLLDEPTAFLDFHGKLHLFKTLRSIAREKGKSVLVSTHDVELAMRVADRLWVADKGYLYTGTVEELQSRGVLQSFIDGDGYRYNTKEQRIEYNQR